MKLSDLPIHYQRQAMEKLANENENRNTDSVTNVERAFSCKPLGTKENPRFNTPVRIDIRTTRRAETDNRAVSEKAVVDGLVKAGILKNDTKKEIKELNVYEPEINKVEKTIIEIIAF